MQKIFVKRFIIIMIVTVAVTLVGNLLLQTFFSQRKADKEAADMLVEISDRIEDNEKVIEELVVNLNENYTTRAKAFAQMIVYNPQMLESYAVMEQTAKLLHVDEVHVIDEKGILQWGNVKSYYGMDFAATEQTRPFLPALTDKSFELAQEPQLNGIEGKLFQYIGVARIDKPGIVQVGVAPEILDNALQNNRIEVAIGNFNVNKGIRVVAIDTKTGMTAADSQNEIVGKRYQSLGISEALFQGDKTSGWIKKGDEKQYAVMADAKGYRFVFTFTKAYLFTQLKAQTMAAAISSILLGAAIIIAIFLLLKHMIVKAIEVVNHNLSEITAGNLDITVSVNSTPEFEVLSSGINKMAASIKQQIEAIKEQNENILASLQYARKIQNNLLPPERTLREIFSDYSILWEPKDIVGGDIYWTKGFEQGTVVCVCDCTGHGTPGALLTMLVSTVLNNIVNENTYTDTAEMLWRLDQNLISILNAAEKETSRATIKDGADLILMYIARDDQITMSSAKMHLFVCDGNEVKDIKGQKLTIGDGTVKSKSVIKSVMLNNTQGNAYYIASDGLFEQVGGKDHIPFGYRRFKRMILENHESDISVITEAVWKEFEIYTKEESRRDDITMLAFRL